MMAAGQSAEELASVPPLGGDLKREQRRSSEPPREPIRRCLASGERLPQDRLLRFVVGPENELVPDLAARLPGRGLWIRPERALLERAISRGLFARAARAPVRTPPDLVEHLGAALRRRCQDRLGMSRRAGLAVAGHDKVRSLLEKGAAAVLLQAADGSPAQRAKLRNLGLGRKPDLDVIEILTAVELGDALGRTPCVHVALLPGGLAERVVLDCTRLAAYEVQHDAGRRADNERQAQAATTLAATTGRDDTGRDDTD